MLRGERGPAVQKAMEIIVAVGEALGAERLIPVSSVHVSGVSVSNIGAEGVELIEWFLRAGGRVVVEKATVNPMGFDLDGVLPRDEREWRLQLRLLDALRRMGFRVILSCTPYRLGNRPSLGEHVAWAESSAVIYANSVLGARTNREGGIVALAAALTGRIYEYGLHLDEARRPHVRVKLRGWRPRDEAEAGLLGAYLGLRLREIPVVEGLRGVDEEAVINLLAAAAAWGSHALVYLEGVSPERPGCGDCERLEVDRREAAGIAEEEFIDPEDAEAVFIGCPHATPETVRRVEDMLAGCGAPRIPVYIATPGCCIDASARYARLLRGTCLVVYEVKRLGVRSIATNSLKAAFYLKRRHGLEVAVAPLEQLLRVACGR